MRWYDRHRFAVLSGVGVGVIVLSGLAGFAADGLEGHRFEWTVAAASLAGLGTLALAAVTLSLVHLTAQEVISRERPMLADLRRGQDTEGREVTMTPAPNHTLSEKADIFIAAGGMFDVCSFPLRNIGLGPCRVTAAKLYWRGWRNPATGPTIWFWEGGISGIPSPTMVAPSEWFSIEFSIPEEFVQQVTDLEPNGPYYVDVHYTNFSETEQRAVTVSRHRSDYSHWRADVQSWSDDEVRSGPEFGGVL